ncbi:MAG: hypothetical protein WCG87_02450 [Bacteroidota bacterium]
MDNLLKAANKYAEGLKHVERRRATWQIISKELKGILLEIADHLNSTAEYKPGYYVDLSHAYDDEINGTCVQMPLVTFRSGNMPMGMSFNSSVNGIKEYTEKGFKIGFYPAVTGLIFVMLHLHHNDFQPEELPPASLMVIDDPNELSKELVQELIAQGIETAYQSSYTGISEHQEPTYSPIGFKMHDTTEPTQ